MAAAIGVLTILSLFKQYIQGEKGEEKKMFP